MNPHPDDIDRIARALAANLTCDRGNLTEAVFAVAAAMVGVAEALHEIRGEIAKWDIEVGEKADGEEPAP